VKSLRLVPPLAFVAATASGCIFPFDRPDCEPETVYVEVDDLDRDGSSSYDDCDDQNPAVHPGAYDIPDDGIDQDCDGVDATRLGPTGACAAARPALFGENPGDTGRSAAVVNPSCASLSGSAQVFVLVPTGVAAKNRVSLAVSSDVAHTLHVRTSCVEAESELVCAGDAGRGAVIEAEVGAPLYVFVSAIVESGPFVLSARQEPLLCGDGYDAAGETCDDGN
jgi:hypothetical protein